MKKFTLFFMILTLLMFVGCANNSVSNTTTETESVTSETSQGEVELEIKTPVVYTTIYPLYALTQSVGGDLIDLKMAMPFGADPHDFEPSAKLIASIEKADVLIYNGAGLEPWLEGVLGDAENAQVKVLEASKGLELLKIDADDHHDHGEEGHEHGEEGHEHGEEGHEHGEEGHEHGEEGHEHGEEGHDHGEEGHEHGEEGHEHGEEAHEHDEDAHGHHHHGEYDPHVWQDPLLAKQQAEAIYNILKEQVDSSKLEVLEENYNKTIAKLDAIDKKYSSALSKVKRREIVVSHAAFGYLCHRYDLKQIAIAGLSTLDEPSAATLAKITDIAKEHGVKVIFFDALGSDKLAKVVAEEVGVKIMPLSPIESVSQEQLDNGEDYFTIMEKNLESLVEALSE